MEIEKIFGLSITEQIEWGICHASGGRIIDQPVMGIFDGIDPGNLPHYPENRIEIQTEIRNHLEKLKSEKPDIFEDVSGIGVSTIGVVNRQDSTLDSLVRKNWIKSHRHNIIDFDELFFDPYNDAPIFPHLNDKTKLILQSDVSARCMAEYLYGFSDPQNAPLSMLYIAVGEGINGAFAYQSDLLHMARHSEMGHIRPQLHPDDFDLDATISGCKSHITCFEGVATNARFRRQYGHDLQHLDDSHPAWKIEAYYLAQMVMIGTLTLNPERIVLTGSIMAGSSGRKLLEKVRKQFKEMNNEHLPDYRSKASANRLIDRARLDNGIKALSALTMGAMLTGPSSNDWADPDHASVPFQVIEGGKDE